MKKSVSRNVAMDDLDIDVLQVLYRYYRYNIDIFKIIPEPKVYRSPGAYLMSLLPGLIVRLTLFLCHVDYVYCFLLATRRI